MPDFRDLPPLKADEDVMKRVTVAVQAAVHDVLVDGASTSEQLRVAKDLAKDPRDAADRLFYLVLTSTTILAKIQTAPNTITDADLTASASEVIDGLARV
jgi:hypothetical protein